MEQAMLIAPQEKMSDKVFDSFSQFIQSECGIKMPRTKKPMLEARLRKRLIGAGFISFDHYCDYVLSPRGIQQEAVHLIDAVTTNKTEFFREPIHFDYLVQTALPKLRHTTSAGDRRKLRVWSAGCATGEEAYSLAMVLSDFAEKNRGFDFSILATDISTRALEIAQIGIYDEARIDGLPMSLKQKYFLRSKDRDKQLVRVNPELRQRVQFGRLNLMDNQFEIGGPIDIIFCRNVFIYFDQPTQRKVMQQFHRNLAPGGYIVLGLTEAMGNLTPSLVRVASTIYQALPVKS